MLPFLGSSLNLTVPQPSSSQPSKGIRALVISSDLITLPVLADALQRVSVVPIACDTQLAALDLLWQDRFDAVIVDCDSLANGLDLLKAIRQASGRTAVLLSLVSGEMGMKAAFERGANLVIEKPVTAANVERTLRAARSLMVSDHRRYFRLHAEFDVHLHSEFGNQVFDMSARSTDVSIGGMALRVPQPLEPRRILEVSFKPAGMEKRIHAEAEVAWSDARGECGLRFLHIPLAELRALEKWSTAELQKLAGGAKEVSTPQAK
jgi:DNA-binding response OmpR family regulator